MAIKLLIIPYLRMPLNAISSLAFVSTIISDRSESRGTRLIIPISTMEKHRWEEFLAGTSSERNHMAKKNALQECR